MSDFYKKVAKIQSTLKAPKSQYNGFGKYAYRNAEDILEAVKPLLGDLVLTINDELVLNPGGENYIKATAMISDGVSVISNSALAREANEQKGMNPAQITGSTSSYARKYALNGLFLIDDTKDADATNTHGKEDKAVAAPVQTAAVKAEVTPAAGATSAVKPSFRRPQKPTAQVASTGDDL